MGCGHVLALLAEQQPSHFFDPSPDPYLAEGKHRLTKDVLRSGTWGKQGGFYTAEVQTASSKNSTVSG